MTDKPTPTDAELQSIIDDADAGPPTDKAWLCLECGQWTPWRHEEAHDHADGCKAPAIYAAKRDWKTRLKDYMAKWGQPSGAGEVDRADAVNLARNCLGAYNCAITKKGIRVLAEAVLSMDSALSTPQPTQPQAGAVPLTDEQIRAMLNKHPPEDVCGWSYRMGIDDAELHHGIKGGQHGTE